MERMNEKGTKKICNGFQMANLENCCYGNGHY